MEMRRTIKQALPSIIGLCLCAYFVYHFFQGDRGVFTLIALEAELNKAYVTRDELAEKRTQLENRVARLSSDQLDPDLLDERARLMLDLASPNERVILLPDPAP